MEQVLILLVTLAGVTHAFLPAPEIKCNATHNSSLCSVTLGGSVYIQVMTNASGHQLRCKKQLPTGSINVFTLKKEKVTIQEPLRNRTQFFINSGTLKISNVERDDSGQYNIDVFDANGVLVKNIHIKLDVQENILPILIVCSAVGVLLMMLICCCAYCKMRRRKKSGSGKQLRIDTEV